MMGKKKKKWFNYIHAKEQREHPHHSSNTNLHSIAPSPQPSRWFWRKRNDDYNDDSRTINTASMTASTGTLNSRHSKDSSSYRVASSLVESGSEFSLRHKTTNPNSGGLNSALNSTSYTTRLDVGVVKIDTFDPVLLEYFPLHVKGNTEETTMGDDNALVNRERKNKKCGKTSQPAVLIENLRVFMESEIECLLKDGFQSIVSDEECSETSSCEKLFSVSKSQLYIYEGDKLDDDESELDTLISMDDEAKEDTYSHPIGRNAALSKPITTLDDAEGGTKKRKEIVEDKIMSFYDLNGEKDDELYNRMNDKASGSTSSGSSMLSFSSEDFIDDDSKEREINRSHMCGRNKDQAMIAQYSQFGPELLSITREFMPPIRVEEEDVRIIKIFFDDMKGMRIVGQDAKGIFERNDSVLNEDQNRRSYKQNLTNTQPKHRNIIKRSSTTGGINKSVSWSEEPKIHLFVPEYEVMMEMASSLVQTYINKKEYLVSTQEVTNKTLKETRPPPSSILRSKSRRPSSAPAVANGRNRNNSGISPLLYKSCNLCTWSNAFGTENPSQSIFSNSYTDVDKGECAVNFDFENRSSPSLQIRGQSSEKINTYPSHSSFVASPNPLQIFDSRPCAISSCELTLRDTDNASGIDCNLDGQEPSSLLSAPCLMKSFGLSACTTSRRIEAASLGLSPPPLLKSTLHISNTINVRADHVYPVPNDVKSRASLQSATIITSEAVETLLERIRRETDRRRYKARRKRNFLSSRFTSCFKGGTYNVLV